MEYRVLGEDVPGRLGEESYSGSHLLWDDLIGICLPAVL
jgi:hypothetical protein